jgi:hypothetical protein
MQPSPGLPVWAAFRMAWLDLLADDDGGQGALDFTADANVDGHGDEADGCDQCAHEVERCLRTPSVGARRSSTGPPRRLCCRLPVAFSAWGLAVGCR